MMRILILVFMFFALPALAQDAVPAPAAEAKKEGPGLFGGDGATIDITADQSLEWHEDTRMYIARGHAKAVRGDVTVTADVLKAYDRQKADGGSEVWKLEAEGRVKVVGKTQSAEGDTAVYDIDSKKAILRGQSLSYITATDKVTAKESLEYWETENLARAVGDATAIREGRQVRADELITYFTTNAKGEQTADKMEAKGKVHIVTEKDVVFCDNALYYATPNTATLTGNVFITRGESQIKGDKAEANFKTGVSRILNSGKGRVHALVVSAKGGNKAAGKKTGAAKPAPRTRAYP